jgi:hypothetical protein
MHRSQSFFRKVTNCESFSNIATYLLYCILDASVSAIVYLVLLVLLSRQIDRAHSPAALTRLSLWTFLIQAIVDALAFAGHITFAILANGRPSMSLVAPGFLAALLFALEAVSNANWVLVLGQRSPYCMVCSNMRFSLIKSRPQRTQQPNKLDRPRLLHRMPPHQLPTPLNPSCPCQSQHHLRDPHSSSSSFVTFGRTHKLVFVRVHSSSQFTLVADPNMFPPGLGMFWFLMFIIHVIVTPSLALLFVASMYSMFWFPQIIRSARRGRPSALSAEYLIGTSICRLYFALCERFRLEVRQVKLSWLRN